MGMYTEFHFNVKLKKDLPEEVLSVLKYMVRDGEEPEDLPDHIFFETRRWSVLFTMDSYYFDADTHSTLRQDGINSAWYLCVRSNLKDYDDEIRHFLSWIHPYLAVSEDDLLGFWRYEEDIAPTLIYSWGCVYLTKEVYAQRQERMGIGNDN